MIDFHISGRPTLTKHRLLAKLCRACGAEWAVKYGAGSSFAWALSRCARCARILHETDADGVEQSELMICNVRGDETSDDVQIPADCDLFHPHVSMVTWWRYWGHSDLQCVFKLLLQLFPGAQSGSVGDAVGPPCLPRCAAGDVN